MKQVLKENDIITLDTDDQMMVIKTMQQDEDNYVLLSELVKDENTQPKLLIAIECVDKKGFSLDFLDEEEEIHPILMKFQEKIRMDLANK
ncbi:MAG: hypothetical protein IJW59_01505 [Clostridia bacterium]|nr:hypothetical protein [Clostridia bacterium]